MPHNTKKPAPPTVAEALAPVVAKALDAALHDIAKVLADNALPSGDSEYERGLRDGMRAAARIVESGRQSLLAAQGAGSGSVT